MVVVQGEDLPVPLVEVNPVLPVAYAVGPAPDRINVDGLQECLHPFRAPDFDIRLIALVMEILVVDHEPIGTGCCGPEETVPVGGRFFPGLATGKNEDAQDHHGQGSDPAGARSSPGTSSAQVVSTGLAGMDVTCGLGFDPRAIVTRPETR